jgi:hypothetical protein
MTNPMGAAPLLIVNPATGEHEPPPRGHVECTNAEYHGGPGVSKSMLDAINISPLNYWDVYVNPDREPREYKHAFAIGDGTHKLVLEPGTFEETYSVGFDKKAYPQALDTIDQLKQALNERGIPARGSKPELVRLLAEEDPSAQIMLLLEQQHNATMEGKIALPAQDYKNMLQMLRAVNTHHAAAGLLYKATVEQSFFWTDPEGVLRKCRTDAITSDGGYVADLKTTDDVSRAGFGATIAKRRYHVQAAWYLDILRALYGRDAPRGWAFVAAQKYRPFDVAVHYLTDEQIQLGRLEYQQDLSTLTECLSTDVWHGVDGGDLIEAQLPVWTMRRLVELEEA